MSLIKQLFPFIGEPAIKFNPASTEVNWERVETLVHGPGAGEKKATINSAVFACLMAISTAYIEPPLKVFRKSGSGDAKEVPEHPLQALIDKPTPNGELTIKELLFWTAWAKHVDGNAYWMKVRSGNANTGNVVEIWPVSPTVIEPASEGGEWISYYKYQDRPGHWTPIPVENIVHFRLGIDDADMRKGLSPLKALIREISSDDEASKFTSMLLKNYAVPGLVVIPTGGTMVTRDDAERLAQEFKRKFGTDGRGNVAIMSRESSIQQFGFSPEELNMSTLHRIPEERISAVMGVPAIVAGLGAGLDRATYANAKELGEWFTERKLIPGWQLDSERLNVSLTPDFANTNRKIYLEFDITDVRALQEDEDAKYTRLQKAVGKPWITINEAREDTGYDAIEGEDELAEAQNTTQQIDQTQQQNQQGQQPDNQNGSSQNGNNGNQPPNGDNTRAALRKWERFALRKMHEGKKASAEFINDDIPAALAGAIMGALEEATSSDDVKRTFDNALIWRDYP